MKKKILLVLTIFCFLIIILFNIDILSETKYFNIGSGEIKKEKRLLYIKIYETKEETDFGNILKKNNLHVTDANWIFVGSVKYIGFSKMYVCGVGGALYEASKDFCSILETNINDNTNTEIKKKYIKSFQNLLKTKNKQEITAFLQELKNVKQGHIPRRNL